MPIYSRDELRDALSRDEVLPDFQPQVDVGTGRIVAVEALSRWHRGDGDTVMPADLLPSAREHGLLGQVDRDMLAATCRAVAAWREVGLVLDVSANIAVSTITAGWLLGDLHDCIAAGLDPSRFTLEITETEPLRDAPAARAVLDEVIALGMGVSIDDFGTGFADAALLDLIPATELKLDRSLVQADDGRSARDAMRLAHERDLRTVAEGVSTPEQWALARELGCDRAQGFLFSEAVSPTALAELVLR